MRTYISSQVQKSHLFKMLKRNAGLKHTLQGGKNYSQILHRTPDTPPHTHTNTPTLASLAQK